MTGTYERPASSAQRRLWLLDRMDPGLAAHNVAGLVELTGPLDVDALRAALVAVVARHEVLRTTLREHAGEPVQVVAAEASLGWRVTDLSMMDDPDTAGRQRAMALASAPFDLRQGPLVRAEVVRLHPHRHLLVLVGHHVVADEPSLRLLIEQLADDYAGQPVAAPPRQYADIAAQPATPGPDWLRAEEYWRTELADVPTSLELPGVRPRPSRPSYRIAVAEFDVPAPLADALRGLVESGAAADHVFLAGFAATVARWAGRADLVVGLNVSGRESAEADRVVGPFATTVPVRLRLRPGITVRQYIDDVYATVSRSRPHQHLPFDRIVELVGVPRDPSRSPLIQVMFQIGPAPSPGHTGELCWTWRPLDTGASPVDLHLALTAAGDGSLTGRLTYAIDLYDAAWARRFVDSLLTLLASLADRPGAELSTLDYLPPAERARVTGDFATGAPLPGEAETAIDLLAGVASEAASTSGGLSAAPEAARIAGALRTLGVGPEAKVGICLPRDQRLIPALLGVWWAGAAYVPLDPAFPPARLAAMVQDSGLRVVLGAGDYPGVGDHPGFGDHPGVTVLTYDDAVRGEPVPRVSVPPQAAAYTIFTSGSTGRPKGVTVTQGNVAALLRAFRAVLPLGAGDHLVAVTTLSFDISVLELLLPAVCGARVTTADAETAMDPNALRRLLRESGATAMQATPATWRALVTSGGIPESVRLRLCGGEALPRDLAADLVAGDAEVWNVYGPTETTVWSAAGRVEPGEPVRIGPPIPGTRIYVLDDALRPVPAGVTGQVFIGGAGVARGYHDKPGLTAQRFVPDPFSDRGERLYATGDLGRWDPDGRIELLGRIDHQVKLRGFRIEIEEIETALRSCPGVADAAVALVSEPDPRLVAYVVPTGDHPDQPGGADDGTTPGRAGLAEELARRLARRLPEYMVPAQYQILDRLPRTPNGKLDRAALPAPAGPTSRSSRPARTPVERELARVWQDVLKLNEPPGVEDNFFVLGGHSLLAVAALARVRDTLGVEVPLRELFNRPTIAGLAEFVEITREQGPPSQPADPWAGDLDDETLDDLLRELLS